MGFARCVTIFSNLSKMSVVFSAKKSGYVFMIAVCTDSSALLYNCARTLSSGNPVIFINTDQSTRNFRNCCEVISACSCGALAEDNCTDARALVAFDCATLLILRIERASPITVTPSSVSILRSSISKVDIVSFSWANFSAYTLADSESTPASVKMIFHSAASIVVVSQVPCQTVGCAMNNNSKR